jgi:hypothetical protein
MMTAVYAASAHTLEAATWKMTFGANHNHDSSAVVEVKEEEQHAEGAPVYLH